MGNDGFDIMVKTISNDLPNDINELNWIITKIGYILLGSLWDDFEDTLVGGKEYKNNIKESKTGSNMIDIIHSISFNRDETKYLINHLFTESIKKKKILLI